MDGVDLDRCMEEVEVEDLAKLEEVKDQCGRG